MRGRPLQIDWRLEDTPGALHTAYRGQTARVVRKTFGTFADDLTALRSWLAERGVTHGAMEGTGTLWVLPSAAVVLPSRAKAAAARAASFLDWRIVDLSPLG